LAQLTSTVDPAQNLELVREHVQRASASGAEMMVFPEAMMCSFVRRPDSVAEAWDGPWASGVREIAAQAGIVVITGMFVATSTEQVTNSLLVTGPGVEARYDKIHLFDALGYQESRRIAPGYEPVVVEVGGTGIGLATCYDIRFPALFARLARLGAEVIVVPASWAPGQNKIHQWRTLATARAMDSTCFVVACGQSRPSDSEDSRPTGVGHSLVVDPLGTVVLELDEAPELAFVDLDLTDVARARESMPVLRNARSFEGS
jgi:predicted amidohydrolase